MDAKHWNGDVDPREFGIDPDDERCPDCGASEQEDCAWYCRCDACERGLVQQVIAAGDEKRKVG